MLLTGTVDRADEGVTRWIYGAFRVRNYKSIHDSGAVTVEPNVTCLVGKNENGNTALLEALYRLKPVAPGHAETFEALRDYPRRFYGRDKAKIAGLPVIDATYELFMRDGHAISPARLDRRRKASPRCDVPARSPFYRPAAPTARR
jgi:hypothetical protein